MTATAALFSRSYREQLPQDIATHAAISFAFSCAIGSLLSWNIGIGVMVGSLAALSNLVADCAKPLFKSLWKPSPTEESRWQKLTRRVVVLTLVTVAAVPLLASRIPLYKTLIMSLLFEGTVAFTAPKPTPWTESDLTVMA